VKITGIRTLVVNAAMRNWVFVQVRTDQPGLEGWGEATLEWKTRAVVGAIEDLTPLLLGRDPRDVEQLVRVLTKHSFWRLGVIGMSAISGIEMACHDIFGKSLGVPVWRLLGGRTRDRVPVYTHLGLGEMTAVYESLDEAPLVERAHEVIERGYRALKAVFIPYTHYTASPRQIDKVARCMGAIREAVGEEVEIMVDFHGRCASASVALQYIEALAPFRPLFVEEPLPPGETLGLAAIKAKTTVPLATGERLVDRREFDELLRARAVDIAQPDLCHVGGFGEARKIAAMAEVASCGIAPHNPLGPIAGVAALHFDVATPNFVIQEEMVGAVPWYSEVVRGPIRMEDGCWQVPEKPGLGIEIDEAVAAKHPFEQEVLHTSHAVLADGTVVDW
jgi:galactonate dehydratase